MKMLKTLLCLTLVLAMTLSLCVVSLAAGVSHVSYNETTVEGVTTVESRVYVAGQDKDVKLYTAIYDAEGNFVSATTSKAAKTGLLTTSVTKGEGQFVKSFVWDAEYTPKHLAAEEGDLSADDIKDVEITIDGKPVSDFGIENLALGGNYDIDVVKYNINSIPTVKVTTKVPTVTCKVEVDTKNLKTVVTIAKGSNNKATVTKTVASTKTYDVQRYERASDTITFNWIKDYFSEDNYYNAVNSTATGWGYNVITDLSDRTSKTFTLAENETVKKVSVKFATYLRQENVIIVKPAATAADSYKADPKSILVDSTGGAATWTNDTNVINDYAWAPGSEGYNTGCIISRGKTTSNKIVDACGNVTYAFYPVKAITSNDNGYETGSRTCTDRYPDTHQKQIYTLGADTDLLGMPYIVGPSTTYTNGVVTFYIADDAEVVVLSRACGTITFAENDGEFVAHDSKTSSGAKAVYSNTCSAADTAWLLKKGYIVPADIASTTTNANKKLFINGSSTSVAPTSYILRTWDYVARDTQVVPSGGRAIDDKYATSKNLTYQDILDMWVDHEFTAEENALIKDFNAVSAFKGTDTFRYPENSADYNNDKYADIRQLHENHTYSVAVTGNQAVLQPRGSFPGRTIYIDRDGETNGNATGVIIDYPEALGLHDSYAVLPALNLVNGPRFGAMGMTISGNIAKLSDADVWRQAEPQEWASFTVTRDARVSVFCDGNINTFTDDLTGWSYTALPAGQTLLTLTNINGDARRSFGNLWTKYFPAGSKVTLTTPKASSLYVTFIDEWEDKDKAISADLTAITLDGVALDGFDADTTEYTYTIGVNTTKVPAVVATPADKAAKVTVVNPTEFPGNLKVKVSNDDVEKVYTINFEIPEGPYSNNLKMATIEGVNHSTSAATLHTNFQNGDACFNDRLTNANMKMKNIASEYIGKEWVRGSLGWTNDSANAYSAAWKSTTLYPDWVSFDITRDATIHVICDKAPVDAVKARYLVDNGWGYGFKNDGYITVFTDKDVKLQARYTKHFTVDPDTGKATVQLPNIGGLTMHAIIVYDGWVE